MDIAVYGGCDQAGYGAALNVLFAYYCATFCVLKKDMISPYGKKLLKFLKETKATSGILQILKS